MPYYSKEIEGVIPVHYLVLDSKDEDIIQNRYTKKSAIPEVKEGYFRVILYKYSDFDIISHTGKYTTLDMSFDKPLDPSNNKYDPINDIYKSISSRHRKSLDKLGEDGEDDE